MPKINYAPYLHVTPYGGIWWLRGDAIRLAAGFLPVSDDHQTLVPKLTALTQRARVNERTLIGALGDARLQVQCPRMLERDGAQYVEATEFLEWLSSYISQTQANIQFPSDLDSEVRKAKAEAAASRATEPVKPFESLTLALEHWFEKTRDELPATLRHRVDDKLFPMPWDELSPDQRRSVALQADYQHDPATEEERKFWWKFFQRMDELKDQISTWDAVATPTAGDLAKKEARLQELRKILEGMRRQQRAPHGGYSPKQKAAGAEVIAAEAGTAPRYIPYPMAMKLLEGRLGATPEELASWVNLGAADRGLAAYLNANELESPPLFSFDSILFSSFDYVAPLMACWFKEDDILEFDPSDRYITGAMLIDRWGRHASLRPEEFIRAKIAESRLTDIHPLFGFTQGTNPDESGVPPLSSGLFAMSEVGQIEAEDGLDISPTEAAPDTKQPGLRPGNVGALLKQSVANDALARFRKMENLRPREITITFVGDPSEFGLAGNDMLEISARDVTRRVPLAALDLVDRRGGVLNQPGAVLVGLAEGKTFCRSHEKFSATAKRLRAILRDRLGIAVDPFSRHTRDSGWKPLFAIKDARGRADERAKQTAERSMASFDHLLEKGHQFADKAETNRYGAEEDAAERWLDEHDPTRKS